MDSDHFDIDAFFDPRAFIEGPVITESTMTQPITVMLEDSKKTEEPEEREESEEEEEEGFEVYIQRRRGGGVVERVPIEQYCGELKQDGIDAEMIKSMVACRLRTSAEVRRCGLMSYRAPKGKERIHS